MGTHAKSASESYPIGLKWGGATRLALLLGIVGLGCWIIDKRVHSAGMALYAVLAILFCAAIGLVSSGIAAERQAAWSFVTWFEGGCFGGRLSRRDSLSTLLSKALAVVGGNIPARLLSFRVREDRGQFVL